MGLGLGRASAASAALALALDLAGESAEDARRRCGDGDGLSRGAAAAAPAATMALRSRGISRWFLGLWGLREGGVSFRFKMGGEGVRSRRRTARQRKGSGSQVKHGRKAEGEDDPFRSVARAKGEKRAE